MNFLSHLQQDNVSLAELEALGLNLNFEPSDEGEETKFADIDNGDKINEVVIVEMEYRGYEPQIIVSMSSDNYTLMQIFVDALRRYKKREDISKKSKVLFQLK